MPSLQPRKYLLFVEEAYSFSILRPIQTEIRRIGGEVKWFLMNPRDSQLKTDEESLKNNAEVQDYHPDAVLVPGNWVPHFFPGLKVQVFHGFGIEKETHFRIRDFFDLYCTHGNLTTKWFQEQAAQKKHFRTIETGWPKMDPFVHEVKARDKPSLIPRILFAPTFNPTLTSAPALKNYFKECSQSGRYQIRIKFHPMMNLEYIAEYEALQNDHLSIEQKGNLLTHLNWADLVISDTSSVIAESLCAGRPVITFRTLKPQDHTLDITDITKFPAAVEDVLERYESFKLKGDDYAKEMHPYKDGKSSLRVLEAIEVMLTGGMPEKKKSLNFFRKRKVMKVMKAYL